MAAEAATQATNHKTTGAWERCLKHQHIDLFFLMRAWVAASAAMTMI
jgi:hypothetical protein